MPTVDEKINPGLNGLRGMSPGGDHADRALVESGMEKTRPGRTLPMNVRPAQSLKDVLQKDLPSKATPFEFSRIAIPEIAETSAAFFVHADFIVPINSPPADIRKLAREGFGGNQNFIARFFVKKHHRRGEDGDIVVEIEEIKTSSAQVVIAVLFKGPLNRQFQLSCYGTKLHQLPYFFRFFPFLAPAFSLRYRTAFSRVTLSTLSPSGMEALTFPHFT